MVTDQKFADAAKKLKCKVSDIRAVDEVESGGLGMQDGRPIILFEPHIFWKQLKKRGLDPAKIALQHNMSDMLYPIWGTKKYPKGQAAQYERLERAKKIDVDSALLSCSWGRYQIMAFNWSSCKCTSLQDFVQKMYAGDDSQLDLFVNYIITQGLDDELRDRSWDQFARAYNGPLYTRNNYAKKLATAKAKWALVYG